MLSFASDWTTVSSLATGVGTLVLAIATFASVRSANKSARVAEAALQEQRRPLLSQSRFDDPVQKINFVEGRWVKAAGGRAAAEHVDGTVYLAISLRNVGAGIAVCQGWSVMPGMVTSGTMPTHTPVDEFRRQSRDLYIPAGDIGMWQGALRNPDDAIRAQVVEAIETRQPLSVELLYSDQVGGQGTITRFGVIPVGEDAWIAHMNRNWYLEGPGPRPDSDVTAAAEAVLRDREAHEQWAAAQTERVADGAGSQAGTGSAAEEADTPEAPQPGLASEAF